MNRDRAKELLPIIQAFIDGKKIEYSIKGRNNWVSTSCPVWRDDMDYRIKPDPTYLPFEDVDECYKEMQKHEPFGWVITKGGSHIRRFISSIGSIGPKDKRKVVVGNSWQRFDYMFDEYTFADGTPFGIKVDEYVTKKPYER